MCVIRVAPGSISPRAIREVWSPFEVGRGFALVYPSNIRVIKGLEHERVNREYLGAPTPWLTVLHCRWPTSGEHGVLNVQPFADEKRVFCHNGTLHHSVIAVLRHLSPELPTASDSRLLWENIRHSEFWEAGRLLFAIGQRFVLADLEANRALLIGGWQWTGSLWAHGWAPYVELTLDGRVVSVAPPPDWHEPEAQAMIAPL